MAIGPTWTIGDVTVTSIIESDQHWKWAWLLPDVTDETVESVPWLRPHFVDEKGKLILRIQALVVRSGGLTIAVDTCVGNDKDRPSPLFDKLQTSFLDDLTGAGYPPDTIDRVVCTHLHVDHVGWNTHLVDGEWIPTFPNARYLMGSVEYEHWSNEGESIYGNVMEDSVEPVRAAGLVDLVDSDHRITDEVWLEPTPGHTPGHQSVRISSGGAGAVITGDMVHHPIQLHRVDLASSADIDSAAAVAMRRDRFAAWAADELLVIGTHFAGPGAGRLRPVGDGAEGDWFYDC